MATTTKSKKAPAKKKAPTALKAAANQKAAKAKGEKKTSRCWPGYKPVPGKSPGSKGSCEKI